MYSLYIHTVIPCYYCIHCQFVWDVVCIRLPKSDHCTVYCMYWTVCHLQGSMFAHRVLHKRCCCSWLLHVCVCMCHHDSYSTPAWWQLWMSLDRYMAPWACLSHATVIKHQPWKVICVICTVSIVLLQESRGVMIQESSPLMISAWSLNTHSVHECGFPLTAHYCQDRQLS